MNMLPKNWMTYSNAEEVAQAVVDFILNTADQSIKQRGAFHFVTAGGSTPNRCYQLLSEQQAEWSKWHIYMGDERVYPAQHPDRNQTALENHLLKHEKVTIPPEQIHFMQTELGLKIASDLYNQLIAELFSDHGQFDLCLLGMGEDGHTASLFPGHFYIEDAYIISEHHSPKPPDERLSLSFETLSNSQSVVKIITGESKRIAVKDWLKGENLPISAIEGLEQTLVFISDDALED